MTWELTDMWNTPTDQMTVMPNSSWWMKRILSALAGKKFVLDYGAYGQPLVMGVDPAKGRTMQQQLWARSGYYEYGHMDKCPMTVTLPMGFMPTTGTDNQAEIELPDRWLGVWGYLNYAMSQKLNGWWQWGNPEWMRQCAYNLGRDLASPESIDTWDAFTGSVYEVIKGAKGNAGFYQPVCPIFPGVATPDEVKAKFIPHALSWTCSIIMGGTEAPASMKYVNHPDVGVKYKMAAAPALVQERQLSNGVPQAVPVGFGMMMGQHIFIPRSAWKKTDFDLWVSSKPLAQQDAARTYGNCLMDRGIRANQSGPYDHVPHDSNRAKEYQALGVTPNLLDGVPWQLAVATDPPLATYTDGTVGDREGLIKSYGYGRR